ncbi:MAG: chitobiase/beta-hexosaminidase C-terminal domain-containing protein, partial [Oscillospiraceae bacterium]
VIEAALKTPANCANGAVYYKSCECGKLSKETFQTAALGEHIWSDKWTIDDTHHWHKCTGAGCTLNDNTQMNSYAEHIYDQENTSLKGAAIKAATCTEGGEYYKSCVCGKIGTETFTVPALNHNWSTEWTKTNTHHWHECINSSCPTKADADKDAYDEHTFSDWEITVFATKKSDGVKERTCSDCGYKQTAAVKYIPDSNNEDTGDVNNVTDPENNANNSNIIITKKEIVEKFNLTDEERTKIENGADVNVSLEVGDITFTVSVEEKTKIDEAAAGESLTVEQYLDIKLWKIVDDGVNAPVKTPVNETSSPVTITFKMPDSLLIDANSELERKYYIVRVHNGTTDILDGTFNKATGMFSFKSDKFSGYGVGYSDKVGSPVFTPDSGTEFSSTLGITISSATPGAEIYYTKDGSVPTTASTKYTRKFYVASDTTIKAIAVKAGKPDSDVVTVSYSKRSYSGGGGGGGSYVPSTPTDPVDPADPTTPTDPADPTTPTDPADPTTPTDPADPTTPTDPADPTTPTDPADPTTPADPADPTTPTDPADPTTPTDPTKPADPVDPDKPEGDKPSSDKPATGGDGNNQGKPSGIGGEGGNDNPSTGCSMNVIPLIAAAAVMFATRRKKK